MAWDLIQMVLIFIICIMIIVPPMLVFLLYWMDRKTSRFLYFDSEDTCKMISATTTDGILRIKEGRVEKHFDIDKGKPKSLRSFFSWKPLYFVKWNSIAPMEVDLTTNKIKDIKLTPEQVGQLKESTIIEKLLNPKGEKIAMWIFIIVVIVCLVLGGVIGYAIASKGG